jgi:hypothetical protein
MQMRSWYDILEASLDRAVAIDDIYQSSALLDQLIQQQIDQGIKAENILHIVNFFQTKRMLHRVFMPADWVAHRL